MAGNVPETGEQRFLTRPLSVVLDFARFGAALLVAVGHAVQLGLYRGPFPFGLRMQHYCVIVFFVLSGLVISTSVQGGRSSLPRYFVARVSRILPVAIPALLFAVLAAYVLAGPVRVYIDNSPDDPLEVASRLLPPMAFVSAWPGMPAPVWNPPYWSLCYEVWFYAIFALAVFLRGWARVAAVLVACVSAGGAILLLMPVWLMGVALTHAPAARRLPLTAAPMVLVGCVWLALALFEIDRAVLNPLLKAWWPGKAQWSQWALSDFAMGLVMVLALIAVRPLAQRFAEPIMRLRELAGLLAGFSFTLYLFHWPLLQLARSHGLVAGRNPLAFAALLGLVVALCALISLLTERQSPRFRRWMEARMFAPVEQRRPL
ncbi:acyltransferase family protein [Novosphingobium clariflavum]|uniref:Acyltransferase family protein n=1 Tax=Novosphingobium clariflavum TaxID=2029884 RepID=A0ABV6S7D2_9SPHN|nr:acyltransferase [Novosphingobium clariflavum]